MFTKKTATSLNTTLLQSNLPFFEARRKKQKIEKFKISPHEIPSLVFFEGKVPQAEKRFLPGRAYFTAHKLDIQG